MTPHSELSKRSVWWIARDVSHSASVSRGCAANPIAVRMDAGKRSILGPYAETDRVKFDIYESFQN